ncbi:probable E3 ubiquitin-protein ligase RHC2A [Fagus crenata]
MSSTTIFHHSSEAWQPENYIEPPESSSPHPEFFIELFMFESIEGDAQTVTSATKYIAFNIQRDLLILNTNSTSWLIMSNMLSQMDVPYYVQPPMIQKISAFARELANEADNMNRKIIPMVVVLTVAVPDLQELELSEALRESMDTWVYSTSLVCASKASVEALEKVKVEGFATQCVICMEDILMGFEATRKPCKHVYHEDCIVNWLKESNLCPLCRFQMPVET